MPQLIISKKNTIKRYIKNNILNTKPNINLNKKKYIYKNKQQQKFIAN